MEVSPSGGFLYVRCGRSSGYIEVFSLTREFLRADSELALHHRNESLWAGDYSQRRLSLHRQQRRQLDFGIHGRYFTSGSLSQFAEFSDSVSNVSRAGCASDRQVRQISVRGQSRLHNLAGYSIGSDGAALTLLTTSPFATGAHPSVLATDPAGKYLFVGNQKSRFHDSVVQSRHRQRHAHFGRDVLGSGTRRRRSRSRLALAAR